VHIELFNSGSSVHVLCPWCNIIGEFSSSLALKFNKYLTWPRACLRENTIKHKTTIKMVDGLRFRARINAPRDKGYRGSTTLPNRGDQITFWSIPPASSWRGQGALESWFIPLSENIGAWLPENLQQAKYAL
jgi:hypothetical protein